MSVSDILEDQRFISTSLDFYLYWKEGGVFLKDLSTSSDHDVEPRWLTMWEQLLLVMTETEGPPASLRGVLSAPPLYAVYQEALQHVALWERARSQLTEATAWYAQLAE